MTRTLSILLLLLLIDHLQFLFQQVESIRIGHDDEGHASEKNQDDQNGRSARSRPSLYPPLLLRVEREFHGFELLAGTAWNVNNGLTRATFWAACNSTSHRQAVTRER